MMKKPLFAVEQIPQYLVYAGLAIAALGLAATAYFPDNLVFSRLIGSLNPFKVMIPIVLSWFVLSAVLLSRYGFAIYGKETLKGVLISVSMLSFRLAYYIIWHIVWGKSDSACSFRKDMINEKQFASSH